MRKTILFAFLGAGIVLFVLFALSSRFQPADAQQYNTPTPTLSPTPTATSSFTPSPSVSPGMTPTPGVSPSPSPSPSASPLPNNLITVQQDVIRAQMYLRGWVDAASQGLLNQNYYRDILSSDLQFMINRLNADLNSL